MRHTLSSSSTSGPAQTVPATSTSASQSPCWLPSTSMSQRILQLACVCRTPQHCGLVARPRCTATVAPATGYCSSSVSAAYASMCGAPLQSNIHSSLTRGLSPEQQVLWRLHRCQVVSICIPIDLISCVFKKKIDLYNDSLNSTAVPFSAVLSAISCDVAVIVVMLSSPS